MDTRMSSTTEPATMTPREFKAYVERVFDGNWSEAARTLMRARSTLWRWGLGVMPVPASVVRELTRIEASRKAEKKRAAR